MVLALSLGVCTLVFGIFNLATDIPVGLSAIVLSIGVILPGLWWLRWYQRPRILRGLLPTSLALIIPGAIGLAISTGSESTPAESTSPAVSQTPITTPTVPSSPAASTSITSTTTSPTPSGIEPSTPLSNEIEIPTSEWYQEPAPVVIPPAITTPTPEIEHLPSDSTLPAAPSVSPSESPTPDNPDSEENTPPLEEPVEAPVNPFQDLIDQFFN